MHGEKGGTTLRSAPAANGVFTVRGAATELGVSVQLVYALCAAGQIRHERHGVGRGTIRITEEALDEYRRAAEVKPRALRAPLKHIRP